MADIGSVLREEIEINEEDIKLFMEKCKANKQSGDTLLASGRLKFYKAIGKLDLIEVETNEVNSDVNDMYHQGLLILHNISGAIFFDDSKVLNMFKKIKCPQFNLKQYIDAVKWLYHSWLGTDTDVIDLSFCSTLIYLLAHARDFDEPSKNLYSFFEEGTDEIKVYTEIVEDNLPGDTKYIRRLNQLIADLLCEYNEDKYQQLNLNVTYLTLLLARRIVKSEHEFDKALLSKKTHKDFATLCPHPLDSDLPKLSKQNKLNFELSKDLLLINLILYGYLNSKGRTRKIFRQTCINYMEYNGIGLVKLFYEVAKLYGIEDYKLWDIMSEFKECRPTLFVLAELAHAHNLMSSNDPPITYKLFPFCRLLDQRYHFDMANKYVNNVVTCYALALLLDLKLGQTKSFARNAPWTKACSPTCKKQGENIAKEIYNKINTDFI